MFDIKSTVDWKRTEGQTLFVLLETGIVRLVRGFNLKENSKIAFTCCFLYSETL